MECELLEQSILLNVVFQKHTNTFTENPFWIFIEVKILYFLTKHSISNRYSKYSHLLLILIVFRFWQKVIEYNQVSRVRILEYERKGWTFHAKGLW